VGASSRCSALLQTCFSSASIAPLHFWCARALVPFHLANKLLILLVDKKEFARNLKYDKQRCSRHDRLSLDLRQCQRHIGPHVDASLLCWQRAVALLPKSCRCCSNLVVWCLSSSFVVFQAFSLNRLHSSVYSLSSQSVVVHSQNVPEPSQSSLFYDEIYLLQLCLRVVTLSLLTLSFHEMPIIHLWNLWCAASSFFFLSNC